MTKVGLTKLLSIFSGLKDKKLSDQMFRILIFSLWRDEILLRQEKAITYKDNAETGYELNEFGDILFGFAEGQNNLIEGERSGAIGQGLNTQSFLELLLGSYATVAADQDPDSWVATDRLLAVGNGTGDEARSDALEIFKSGLIRLYNAVTIGDYDHGAIDPPAGTLRYTPGAGLQFRHGGAWITVGAIDNSCEFSFKFEVAEAFAFVCPRALKFTSMTYQQANAPTLSVALNTNMAQFDTLTITPDAVGLVILTGIYL